MAKTAAIGIRRHFTKRGQDAYDMLDWVEVDSELKNPMTNEIVFQQKEVSFPDTWSLNAINIVTQKYFNGTPGTSGRESSLRHLIDRVADTITRHGLKEGYFIDQEESETFNQEMKYILATQRAAFNSPVWFNIGASDRAQQASACFILNVEDTMPSILNWYREEGMIFKGGSGSGLNVSSIRSSKEPLGKSAGKASGPLSFMRGADASAGAIKSGGKTRRAAKMVILNVDHPDIEEFIWCKAIEERKARILEESGFDMGVDGNDIFSVQYQNANNSVRVTDDFMRAVENDEDWQLKAVTSGEALETVAARDLWRQIAEAAWESADPGVQFDTTVNKWHTAPNAGRINGSNPCSEYMHLDNSACNLASINLLHFLNDDGTFDLDAFKHTTEIIFTSQEILVGYSEYPTEKIAKNARKFRELGIGYANLGALLMAQGLPYDSEEGRAQAAAITALMTGHSYAVSAKIAHRVGPFAGYSNDKEAMINVLKMHRHEVSNIDASLVAEDLLSAAAQAWDEAVEMGEKHGVRNSQASLLAPTGTIGLMMDCDTTGIEPDLGLVKLKKLVGGGTMSIVNQTVPRALKTLGYSKQQTEDIIGYIDTEKTIVNAPHLKMEHLPVFACSMGDNTIHYEGHVRMMGAVQPFLSGAISKTVNMPEDATVEDIEDLHLLSWKLGLKAVAIYRDGSKVGQPLNMAKKEDGSSNNSEPPAEAPALDGFVVKGAVKREMPRQRAARTYEFKVADIKGYFTVGEFEDGTPGELWLNISKQGSTLAGVMDALAVSVSHGLQHGVPLKTYVKAMSHMNFAPSGITDDPDIHTASSIVDFIFRKMANEYLSFEDRLELNLASLDDAPDTQAMLITEPSVSDSQTLFKADEPNQQTGLKAEAKTDTIATPKPQSQVSEKVVMPLSDADKQKHQQAITDPHAPLCTNCGNITQRAGSCYVCSSCGATSGCS